MNFITSTFIVAATLWTQFGSALPVSEERDIICPIPALQLANYDDLGGVSGTAVNEIPTPHKGLDYDGFTFAAVTSPQLSGLRPASGTRYAVTTSARRAIDGVPVAVIKAVYPGSSETITGFDLQSLSFGCYTGLIAAGRAVGCKVTITGYRGDPAQPNTAVPACTRDLTSTSSGLFSRFGDMEQSPATAFVGCRNIQYATLSYTATDVGVADALVALAIDNLKYVTHLCPL